MVFYCCMFVNVSDTNATFTSSGLTNTSLFALLALKLKRSVDGRLSFLFSWVFFVFKSGCRRNTILFMCVHSWV